MMYHQVVFTRRHTFHNKHLNWCLNELFWKKYPATDTEWQY